MDFEKNKGYIRSVFKAGHIVTKLAKIFYIIGAVALVVGVLLLSFLPAGAMKVDVSSETRVFLIRSLIGYAADEEAFEELAAAGAGQGLTVEKSEDGFIFTASPTVAELENRIVAIAMLPAVAELAATAVFFHFLARAFKKAVEGVLLFDRGAAADLKLAGTSLWILFAAPLFVDSLVQMITGVASSVDFEPMLVLWGFVLHALARLMEYGATAEERSFASF